MTYRSVMEVLKWTEVDTVLKITPVSQLWQQVCNSQELWLTLIETAEWSYEDTRLPAKETYRALNQTWKSCKCVLVKDKEVGVYNCSGRKWEHTWRLDNQLFESFSAAVLLSAYELLGCGGRCTTTTVFSLKSGVSHREADMLNMQVYICIWQ